jgi:hypothetical protein
MLANPEGGSQATSQTPGDQDPTTATCGNLTLTLTPGYVSEWVPSSSMRGNALLS